MTRYKYDVFLSHNIQDKPIVRQVCRNLRGAGLRVFFDEDSIPAGGELLRSIEEALDASRHILLFLSKASLGSKWVALEIAVSVPSYADASRGALIPVALEELDHQQIRASLRRLKIVNLFGKPANCTAAYKRVLKRLGVDPARAEMIAWRSDAVVVTENGRPPRIVHDLPPAPRFVGRAEELAELNKFWQSDTPGVLSLVGMGGSGKTALLVEFLQALRASSTGPNALFVWSFYDQADPNAFLSSAYEYFTGHERADAKGLAWILMLKESLSRGSRNLMILDGLEKVQRQKRRSPVDKRVRGELEDALLRDVLRRLASGAGSTKAIITTRFPVVDLSQWSGRGSWVLHLDELDPESSLALLRRHEVTGSDEQLSALSEEFGRHALTLDHLGSLLSRFFDGDVTRVSELSPVETRGRGTQGRKLTRILEAYERCLPSDEKAVLKSLCIFQTPFSVEFLAKAFITPVGRKTPIVPDFPQDHVVLRECLDALVQLHLVLRDGSSNFTVHPAIRDHFYELNPSKRSLHTAAYRHLLTLVGRPGTELPTDPARLELLENLVEHLVLSGGEKRASDVYFRRLGGMYHLTMIGEHARGLRILRLFPSIIDYDGFLRFRRGVGDIPRTREWKTHADNLSYYSANGPDAALLLLGRLKDCASTSAAYLQGRPIHVLYSSDFAPRFQALLLYHLGRRFEEARSRLDPAPIPPSQLLVDSRSNDSMDGDFLEEEDLGPNGAIEELWNAEISRLIGDFQAAHSSLEAASRWILRTSSAEHLLAYYLTRGRLCTDSANVDEARRVLSDAVPLAEQFSMQVFLVDLLLELGRLELLSSNFKAAITHASRASQIAARASMRYVWALRASELIMLDVRARTGDDSDGIMQDVRRWRSRVRKLPAPSALVVYLGEYIWKYYETH